MNCRKNVSQLTTAEKTAYVNAVLALKATAIASTDIPDAWAAGARNRYDVYVWIHRLVGSGAHRGPAFLPWHREFLRQFELELQQVSGNSKLTIPYWDWTNYKSLADNSADASGVGAGFPFTADFLGGMGTGADNRVVTGQFAEAAGLWTLNVRTGASSGAARDNTTYLRRLDGQDPNELPTTTLQETCLAINDYNLVPFIEADYFADNNLSPAERAEIFASFRRLNEYGLHNGPHGWVGGNMMPSTSPNDPVFFLHHCNVDKIWAIWQQRNPGGINNYQPASGVPNHAADEVMSMLEQNFFLFPVLNRPDQLLDHKALGFAYDTDLPSITLVDPTINFGVVPENTTQFLPVRFNVETCRKVKFRITAIGGNPAFEVPSPTYEAIVEASDEGPQVGSVFIKLNASTGLGVLNGMATIEAFIDDPLNHYSAATEFSVGSWNVNFSAEIIERPKSAICMVLDRSGSMGANDGTSTTRFQLLENAMEVVRDILRSDDGVGLVYYSNNENRVLDITAMASGGTAGINSAISNPSLEPGGLTAIGKGIIEAADVLNDEINDAATPYTNFGMLVLTDGNQNVTPYVNSPAVDTAIVGLENDIYAVGLGNQGSVSDAVLSDISNYLLITGDMQGDERLFRLTNYFVQILADIKKNDIVLDPIGRLLIGMKHEIEFDISEADIESEVIVLSPYAKLLDVKLITPDGNTIQGNMGNSTHLINKNNQIIRLSYPALPTNQSGTHDGKWKVVLSIDQDQIKEIFSVLKEHKENDRISELYRDLMKHRSVPYSVSVQSYSDLKFKTTVEQTTNTLGSEINLYATLDQYRLPINGNVRAEVILPNGKQDVIQLTATETGRFEASVKAKQSGLYQFRIMANGYSLSGQRFTREALRTASIYRKEPVTPTGDGQDNTVNELICCLLAEKEIARFLKKHKIDAKRLMKCLKINCTSGKPTIQIQKDAIKLNVRESLLLEKLQPLLLKATPDLIVDNLPELKAVTNESPQRPKPMNKPMMMPALKLNKKGKLELLDFSKRSSGRKKDK